MRSLPPASSIFERVVDIHSSQLSPETEAFVTLHFHPDIFVNKKSKLH